MTVEWYCNICRMDVIRPQIILSSDLKVSGCMAGILTFIGAMLFHGAFDLETEDGLATFVGYAALAFTLMFAVVFYMGRYIQTSWRPHCQKCGYLADLKEFG